MSAALLEATALVKSYVEGDRRRRILDQLDLTIPKTEITAILGESGSGKSTLLHILGGIDTADSGSVRVDGAELTQLSDEDRTLFRRRDLGIVFQFFNLLPTLTVGENVAIPLELAGVSPKSAAERSGNMLDRVGLGGRAATFPDRLSGGEQQRVAIARALVHDPALVLADEPTGNLDHDTGEAILRLLEELTRDRGGNLILVTHSPAAAAVADRVLVMRDGVLHPQ